jgi:hypothetical protein
VTFLAFLFACGTRTPLDTGPGSDADGGDADVDADVDTDADTEAEGPTCEEICFRVEFCDLGHMSDCERDCPLVREALTPEAFEQIYSNCIEETCDEIEACAEAAQSAFEPDDAHRDFCRTACDRIEACNLEGNCRVDCLDPDQDLPIPILSQPVLDDLSACLALSCDEMDACFERVVAEWLPEE